MTALKIVEAAALRLAKAKVIGRPALSSWETLIDYCSAMMARSQTEEFRILFRIRGKRWTIRRSIRARW